MGYWPVLMTLAFIVITLVIFTYAIDKVYSAVDNCRALGCPEDAKYVSFTDSDKYYLCSCYSQNNIRKENIICLKSEDEAKIQGKTKSDC